METGTVTVTGVKSTSPLSTQVYNVPALPQEPVVSRFDVFGPQIENSFEMVAVNPQVVENLTKEEPEAEQEKPNEDLDGLVLGKEFDELKQQINDSFSEVANMLLGFERSLTNLEERITAYNARSSHKI